MKFTVWDPDCAETPDDDESGYSVEAFDDEDAATAWCERRFARDEYRMERTVKVRDEEGSVSTFYVETRLEPAFYAYPR